MNLVRFHFSILRYTWAFSIFVPAAHKPTVSYILDSILIFCLFYKIVGEDGVEPPEPLSNWFTASTATPTEYSPRTRTPRVSNDFFVLCFPLDCFMLCQSHRVVSDIIMPFGAILCFLKTPLSSMRACDGLLKLRNIYRTGNQIKHKPMPLHAFAHSDSHTLIRKFFLPIKRMGSIWKKWKFWDSNSGLPGYEPGVLTTELNFLSRKYYQHLKAIFSTVAILCHQSQQRLPFLVLLSPIRGSHPGRLKPL